MDSSKNIKLMIVTPNFNGGGAQKIAVNLANYYTNIGVNVSLVVFNSNGPYKNLVDSKVNLIDLKLPRLRNSFLKAHRIISQEQPTHVLSVLRGGNIVLGLVLFFNKSVKLVFREANTFDEIKKKSWLKRKISFLKLRLGYFRANKIIANSNDTKKDLLEYQIKNSKFISVVSNPVLPVNYQQLADQPINHKWQNNNYKTVINVGRFHQQKNQKLLVEAFKTVIKQIPTARLLLIGEGELQLALEEQVMHLGLEDSVEILPFQTNPWPFYAKADLFVLTSEWEGFGNVLVEALACGTPVISTDCPGGPRFILDNGSYGRLIEPNDEAELSKQIIEMLDNSDLFDKKKLIKRGESFSVEVIGNQYLDVIENA